MAFPTTSVLSTFTTDENPLSESGAFPSTVRLHSATIGRPKKLSGVMAFTGTVNIVETIYSPSFGADQEVFCTIGSKQNTGGEVDLWLRVQNPDSATCSGYQVSFGVVAGTDTVGVYKLASTGTVTQVVTGTLGAMTQELAAGDSIGASIIGTTITVYYKPSGGAWTQIGQGTDSSLTGAGYIGAALSNQTGTIDDFGGGTAVTTTLDNCLPDADVVATGWSTAPLFSKVNDSSDATVITATAV